MLANTRRLRSEGDGDLPLPDVNISRSMQNNALPRNLTAQSADSVVLVRKCTHQTESYDCVLRKPEHIIQYSADRCRP
jgi:hypothetical protein